MVINNNLINIGKNMGVSNNNNLPAMHFTPALRDLAMTEGADQEHHENVAEVARELFYVKTERNAEAKHNIRTEANAIVKDSERKIRKADRLFASMMGSNAVGSGAVLTASVALPILIPFFAASAVAVGVGTFAARAKINVEEETKKVWVYKNFPEAVRSPHVKKEAYKILEKEKESLEQLSKLEKDPKYYSTDDDGEEIFCRQEYKKDYDQAKNAIALAKKAQTDALKEFVKTSFYK